MQQTVYSGSDLKVISFKSVYSLGVARVLTSLSKFFGVWGLFSYFFPFEASLDLSLL